MKILVTGGSGVIGTGAITELLARGHSVRLLSRHAEDDARRWEGVEPFRGDVADPASLRGAAAGCEVVVHIAGIAAESPPEATFERVNVEGTRNIVAEATHSTVRRLVFVSSLGAEVGTSDYHRSKAAAEKIVSSSTLEWVILRPGSVYGPGDEVISTVLKMVRMLPAVPVVDKGDQPFQPIWHEDLAKAIAAAAERDDVVSQTLELAGREVTSMNDLLGRLAEITGRKPVRVPVPMPLASLAARVASMVTDVPIDDTKLTMLREESVVEGRNGLTEVLAVDPTPLDQGLRQLADQIPENLPEEGAGAMHHKRFWADIRDSRYSAAALMTVFRDRVTEIMPIEFAAEPGAATRIEKGVTLTGALPLRGHIQVRAEVVEPTRVVLATVAGHPLAGIVEFSTTDLDGGVRFAIDTSTRASNLFDLATLRAGGEAAQSANWNVVVQRMIEASGGTADGVHSEKRTLSAEEAAETEARIESMIRDRLRAESTG